VRKSRPSLWVVLCLVSGVAWFNFSALGDEPSELKQELNQLREQNRLLQQQLQQQQQMIDQLSRKFSDLQRTNDQLQSDWRTLQRDVSESVSPPGKNGAGPSLGNVTISAEGGVGIFETGKNGEFPNAEMRVDEARLFLEAPLWGDAYFYGQVDLLTRESYNNDISLGELYLDFEDVSKLWGQERLLNLRLGQLYTPFGEEYLARFAIDNPLISHSLSDIWGLSPGIEAYGSAGKFSYVLAVQDGGPSTLHDFTADKSIAARIGYDPASWLHFGVSAMRTGDLSVENDTVSAIWFGGGFFHSIGSTNTSLFHANLVEGDVKFRWKGGWLKTAGGYAAYGDNDPSANNHRDIYYYYAEWVQPVVKKLYGAARWSQIVASGGYPITGNSSFFPGLPTKDIWRLSLGLGYRFNDHLLWKLEYSVEQGRLTDGGIRDHENMVSTEAAFKF
jgi:hypothetical protein